MTFTTRRIREERPVARPRWPIITAAVLRIARPIFGWYADWKKRKKAATVAEHRVGLLKRLLVLCVACFAVFVLFAGVAKALVALKVIDVGTILNFAGADLPSDDDGFTNFLLLGRGDADHDGVDLTDTIMVASMDPRRTKSVVMLSIPRDLYVTDAEGVAPSRINDLYRAFKNKAKREGMDAAAASQQGMKDLMREIGDRLGLTLHHAVMVNFSALVETVDSLGGIEVEVPYDIYDVEYPGPNYSYETFSIDAGPAILDGETALKYVRSRHTTSDFGRAARQQQVIQAIAEKAKAAGILSSPGKMTSLYKILSQNIESTMTLRELLGAAKIAEKLDRSRVISMGLTTATGEPGGFLYTPPRDQFGGAAVLLPISYPSWPPSWEQIESFTQVITHSRSIQLNRPNLALVNAGAPSGQAGILGYELTRYGFPVSKTENAPEDTEASYITFQLPEDEQIAQFFGTLLKMPVKQMPPELPLDIQGQITVVLGPDYTYKNIQTLLTAEQP